MSALLAYVGKRSQLRVLLYLLLAITLPLLLTLYLYNQQFTANLEQETKRSAEQQHDHIIQGWQQEFRHIAEMAHRNAKDYGMISLAKLKDTTSQEAKTLNDYANNLLSEQTFQNRYVEQICLTIQASNRTLCAHSSDEAGALDTHVRAANQRFEPLGVESNRDNVYLMTYSESLLDKGNTQELGRVTIWFNLNTLWKVVSVKNSAQAYVFMDPDQRVVYRNGVFTGGLAPVQSASNSLSADRTTVQSVKQVDMNTQTPWISFFEAPMPRLNETFPHYRMWLLTLFALVFMLCIGGILLFITYVTQPLHELKALMNRAERGDLRAYWTSKASKEWTHIGESYNQMLNRLEDLIKQVKREESLKKEAEMEALHYQLNPHFLYNTLNTIKWVAKIHKTPQISEVVSSLVRLLQASLGKKGDFITLRDEIGLTHDYMEIQKFRYGDRIQLETQVDELTLGCLVPRMLLQPLVENAIIHGIGPAKREGMITIRTWLDRDLLFCQVEDNGVGMPLEEGNFGGETMDAEGKTTKVDHMLKERMSGIGIRHIREKIKLIYGPEFKLHIRSKPGEGTTIRMFLPIHQGEE
ncbi:hypothetical protein A8709_27510 [Paenibacillus pectinilyticus]|uniref:histidine kinase n=1 Tax=Paenibacillus pectinilyticus TaxID=512399 RepID=A0A1C0ZU42_9BACL|nr:sensor histidine kinase [Paenibacillus pectinilyticus]OCT11629.1 hypothetical protein A8709_27510 [Paenibacillus pectinilyticus]